MFPAGRAGGFSVAEAAGPTGSPPRPRCATLGKTSADTVPMTPDETPSSAKLLNLAVHELRTPVSVVAGYLRMLLAERAGPLTDRQRKMLTDTLRSADRLTALVAEMSELSNLEAGTLTVLRQPIALAPLLQEVAAALDDGRERGVRAEVRLTPALGPDVRVTGDAVRLRAALTAVLTTVAREQAGAATIVVAADVEEGSPWAVVRIGEAAAVAALSGPTGDFDEWRGGVGLALPLARRVVEAAGGRVWSPRTDAARSAVGLLLPLTSEEVRS